VSARRDALIEKSNRQGEKGVHEMSRAHRDEFGTAFGPYTGADLAEWHVETLTSEAERARLENAVARPAAAPRARTRKRHVRWHRSSHAH
jgi:hypothetical protein